MEELSFQYILYARPLIESVRNDYEMHIECTVYVFWSLILRTNFTDR